MKKKAEVKKDEGVRVYCGPDIKGVIKSFTSFQTIPNALREAAEKCPVINKLIVPVSELAETRKLLNIGGSAAQFYSSKISEFYKKG